MPARKRPVTWLEVAVRNAGMRKAMTAVSWAHTWAIAREALGHDPTVEEVADWWKMPRRSAFREQAIFREAFPTLETPAKIYESAESREAPAAAAAAFGKIDDWKRQRKQRREVDALRAVMGRASAGQ